MAGARKTVNPPYDFSQGGFCVLQWRGTKPNLTHYAEWRIEVRHLFQRDYCLIGANSSLTNVPTGTSEPSGID